MSLYNDPTMKDEDFELFLELIPNFKKLQKFKLFSNSSKIKTFEFLNYYTELKYLDLQYNMDDI